VLDFGVGIGKLTGTLVALGADVSAVEPDPAMLTELRRALPAGRAVAGSAKAIPLPDASVDAVLAGNAVALVRHGRRGARERQDPRTRRAS